MAVSVMDGRTFDRVANWDDKNMQFKLGVVNPESVQKAPPDHKTYERLIYLDQGTEGGCTGFSLTQLLSLSPHQVKKLASGQAEYFYFRAKQMDEFKGENYEGSSVLGAQKGALTDGFTTAYNWCTTVEEIIAALAFHGPVQLGINWYKSMFTPTAEGVISIASGSPLAGGHAITAAAYKGKGELIRLDQTWGPGWGLKGSCWISATDVSRLLSEEGEAACSVKTNPLHWPNPLPSHARVDPGT